MGIEIERKFLVLDDSWRQAAAAGTHFRQGYLAGGEQASVRVRIEGSCANINIKSATLGVTRREFEYAIPVVDARVLLNELCRQPQIEKVRYEVEFAGNLWEVDVFEGDNLGLVVAEIELDDEGQTFAMPPWVGDEVSHDVRYYNVSLVDHPYKDWGNA